VGYWFLTAGPVDLLLRAISHRLGGLVPILVERAGVLALFLCGRSCPRRSTVTMTSRGRCGSWAGDLGQLRTEVDRGLRTRRFLGYRESMEWARAARPIVAELGAAVRTSPSGALVELLQRAVGHVVRVIQRADDSSGLIGDLARELLALHAQTCDAGVADPVKLASWMIRFRFTDQDFFEVDPADDLPRVARPRRQRGCDHQPRPRPA
jgi:hypothetical protein